MWSSRWSKATKFTLAGKDELSRANLYTKVELTNAEIYCKCYLRGSTGASRTNGDEGGA